MNRKQLIDLRTRSRHFRCTRIEIVVEPTANGLEALLINDFVMAQQRELRGLQHQAEIHAQIRRLVRT